MTRWVGTTAAPCRAPNPWRAVRHPCAERSARETPARALTVPDSFPRSRRRSGHIGSTPTSKLPTSTPPLTPPPPLSLSLSHSTRCLPPSFSSCTWGGRCGVGVGSVWGRRGVGVGSVWGTSHHLITLNVNSKKWAILSPPRASLLYMISWHEAIATARPAIPLL